MGNGLSPCLHPTAAVRLVYWGAHTRLVTDDACITAGDVAAEHPAGGHVVCPADSFFVGLPIPVISPGEELLPGRTYFVLPAARFACLKVLTAATLAALSPAPAKVPLAGPGQCPFEYVKGDGGATLIRVMPEFIEKVITCDGGRRGGKSCGAVVASSATAELCSTPELKRHYAQLVGPRNQTWSPRLETIAECGRSKWLRSPARLLSSR
ncbi:uncharacterized protein LOC133910245 [Phragmites australis]|uniref:uncharacterized protein LOC133910245 n=1 Tax=Phragmites australis TaxID=29695 RepID=UPI002D78BA85|nr:uncharacterized protein LOC133910245 [Phragmites australis]